MKSNIKMTVNKADENKIILSVGMIVKNEEKHLEKCLTALKRLLDRVPSELIIVDTGSTDKTKEIALRFTDKVYDFEWTNDFAAARNCGLKKAVGEWFMFIDADEYLDEDCEEMVKFFNMPEVRNKYNSASINMLNYASKTRVGDRFLAPRIVRLMEGIEFHDPIHEWILQPNPHGAFTTVFHHYGYAFESKKAAEKKKDRNLPLMLEEYKKNPKDMRVLCHMCDACFLDDELKKFENAEKIHLEYLEEARKNITSTYGFAAYLKGARMYIRFGKEKKALEIIQEFLDSGEFTDSVSTLSIYHMQVLAYLNLEDYENAMKALGNYFKYFQLFKDFKLHTLELRFCTHHGTSDYDYENNVMNAAKCCNKLERYDESLEYLEKVSFEDMSFLHLKTYLSIVRELTEKTKNYVHTVKIYEKIDSLGDVDKTDLALYLLEQYYFEHIMEREEFAEAVSKSGIDLPFVNLMKLVVADNSEKNISAEIADYVDSVERWNDGTAEAIFLAMKHDVDISGAIKKMGSKQIREILEKISNAHQEYAQVAFEYCQTEKFSDDIRKFSWMVTALEFAVQSSLEVAYEDRGELYDRFVLALSDYISNIYNPELLNVDDVEVLPELHRFGFYMTLAFTAYNDGDQLGYIRGLKEALKLCSPMRELVSYYLSEFEKSLK